MVFENYLEFGCLEVGICSLLRWDIGGQQVLKKILKLGLAGFAAIFLIIGLLLPYEARKKYTFLLIRFKHAISVIF